MEPDDYTDWEQGLKAKVYYKVDDSSRTVEVWVNSSWQEAYYTYDQIKQQRAVIKRRFYD